MSERTLTVSELNAAVRGLLKDGIGSVSVRGEISNLRRQASGHIYFTLKDAGSQVRAVMFRGVAGYLKFAPADGQSVIVSGELTVYEPRGDYQIRVTRMTPLGKGSLQEQFEALKRKLQAEGLFDAGRKKPLPVFPEKIAVVTSPTGAALRDFLQIIGRRCPRLAVQVFGVRVQGGGAAGEIAAAIGELNRRAEVDVIIVARGGGSLEDLWAFNEEAVARAVAASALPIISGVGHEIDFTICDFAADLRAPTPSAAAELVSLADSEWAERLAAGQENLRRAAADFLEKARWRLAANRDHYVFREPVRIVGQMFQRLDDYDAALRRSLSRAAERARDRVETLRQRWSRSAPARHFADLRKLLQTKAGQLRLLSPQQTLQRGYAIIFNTDGEVLRSKRALAAAQTVTLRVADGEVAARVAPEA
ncbi:MAG: exodeoxyribonuclease VII large subunit [Verrucomicrobiales bacterium]|jgi:exodeoxyribonuclease VII large subunit|nr:exodeoxyribonuclease VII large subunit [Verrucomicrobiales bacterium]